MSRYIDADEFLENNKEFADREIEHPRYQETVRELINEAPSIDIVRCKECKHRYRSGYRGDEYWVCDFMDAKIKDDDFCSYGVRKTNTTAEEKPTPIRDYMVHGEREGE